MKDFLCKLKEHPSIWLGGLFIGAIALTATVTGWFHDSHTAVLEASLAQCKERRVELEGFEDKFHDERVRCTKLEADANQAKQDLTRVQKELTSLKNENWEERYHAEVVTRRGVEEAMTLMEKRTAARIATLRDDRDAKVTRITELQAEIDRRPDAAQERLSDTVTSFDTLLAEKQRVVAENDALKRAAELKDARIAELTDQLRVAGQREAQLRAHVTAGKSSGSRKAWPSAKAKALAAAVFGITDDDDARDAVVKAVTSIKGGVTGAEFALVIDAAKIGDDYYCKEAVVSCAKHITVSLTGDDIIKILGSIQDPYYRKLASGALMARLK